MPPQKPKFDPSKPFEEAKPKFDPSKGYQPAEEQAQITNPDNGVSLADSIGAGLYGFANTASLGTLPYIAAGLEKGISKTGIIPEEKYADLVEQYKSDIKKQAEEHPVANLVGEIPGAFAGGGLVTKGLQAAPIIGGAIEAIPETGMIGRAAKSAIGGGVGGLVQTPETGFSDINARLKQGKEGAIIGGIVSPVADIASKGIDYLKKIPQAAEKLSDMTALKQAGFMLKDLRAADKRGITDEVASFVKGAETPSGKKLLQVGDDFSSIAGKSKEIVEDAGKKIGSIYQTTMANPKNAEVLDKVLPKPDVLRSEINNIVSSVRPRVGGQEFDAKIGKITDEIASHGDQLKDIKFLNKIIGDLDDMVNWGKASNELPAVQKGMEKMRGFFRDKVNTIVDETSKLVGGNLGKEIKDANKTFSMGSRVLAAAKDKALREEANQYFGLSDKMIGGAGAIGGMLGGGAQGSIAGAALGALGSKAARTYGPGVATRGLEKLSNVIGSANAPLNAASGLIQKISKNPTKLGAAAGLLGAKQ